MPRVKELGMDAIAITDHGVMYGVIDFYKEALKNNVKPIIGCEVYTAQRSRFDKDSNIDSDRGHLVLLAENNIGYKNLMKIVSCGFIEGYYYKPRIDMEVLRKYSEGIIALSACLSGDISIAILQGNYKKAKSLALEYRDIFGTNNFYLELQKNNIEEQNLVNQNLIKLSKETGIPLVATNDVHYLRKEDAKAHDILLCIQTGKRIYEEDRMKFNTDDVYLKSPEEMYEAFKNIPEALENTVKIAERCNVEIEFNKLHLPEYDVPDNQDHFEYLKKLCMDGMIKRYGTDYSPEVFNRLNYELSVIKEMGYVDYFLIVWDFIKYAKDNGIMVGPGRGSGAGSIVAYCLGITNIDPLRFNLLFERFLNPERISMPDLDIDFCYERRQEVIDYVVRKYGSDRVAQIITFGTMAARAVIRDVGRAMDIPYAQVDAIAKMIPFRIGMTIDKALEINPELRDLYENDDDVKELINTSKILEGMPRHSSTHAAGVVISKEPLVEYVPLQKNDDVITTQFTMGNLEELGLLKMDFLGLRTLTVLRDAAELVRKNHGVIVDFDKMKLDVPNVYKMISEGKTAGIFQLESNGMTQFMKELKPSCIEDIIAGISLYRPGPMDQIPKYITYKNNPDMVKYDHPLLENILNVTYGCMVYQEQVMQIVRTLAGYSMGRADLVRRAMAKKKADIMKEERQNFIYGKTDENGNIVIEGAIRRGVDEQTANKIFDEMMDFASYAFNKSHAAAYAVIAYQTAWLKYYYPTEFMAALLNSFLGNTDKISRYIAECKAMGIEILPPDINESDVKFSVVNGKIRFGMAAVKNVGEQAVIEIIKERNKNKEFSSFANFCERINLRNVNKKCIESLIKCGAFDSLGIYRSKLLAVFEKVLDRIHESKRKNIEGQLSIFDISMNEPGTSGYEPEIVYPDIDEYPSKVLLAMEKETLGLYVSGHPLEEYKPILERYSTVNSLDFKTGTDENTVEMEVEASNNLHDGKLVTIGGIIADKKIKATKNDNLMAFLTLEDLYGQVEIIVFPQTLSKYQDLITEENIVLVKGRISVKEEEEPKIICEEIRPITSFLNLQKDGENNTENNTIKKINDYVDKTKTDKVTKILLKLPFKFGGNMAQNSKYCALIAMLKFFRGNTPVYFYYDDEKKAKLAERELWVNVNPTLLSELEERLGKENVKVM